MIKKNNKTQEIKISTVLGRDTEFKGNIIARESIRIEGKFEGEIVTEGDIFIGEQSIVSANLKGRNIISAGEIYGNIETKNRLEITPTGKVYGDVKTESLQVAESAVFKGKSETGKEKSNANSNTGEKVVQK